MTGYYAGVMCICYESYLSEISTTKRLDNTQGVFLDLTVIIHAPEFFLSFPPVMLCTAPHRPVITATHALLTLEYLCLHMCISGQSRFE